MPLPKLNQNIESPLIPLVRPQRIPPLQFPEDQPLIVDQLPEVEPPVGDIVQLIMESDQEFKEEQALKKAQGLETRSQTSQTAYYNNVQNTRLYPLALKYGGLIRGGEHGEQTFGFYLSVAQKDRPNDMFALFYEVPASFISSGVAAIEKVKRNLVNDFIARHDYDLENYNFKLAVRKVSGITSFISQSTPPATRIFNTSIAAMIMDQYLLGKGYKRVPTRVPKNPMIFKDDDYQWIYQEPKPKISEEIKMSEAAGVKVSDKAIENSAEFYTRSVTGGFGIRPGTESRIFKPVTLPELKNRLQDSSNLTAIKQNVQDYLIWKKAKYIDRLKDIAFSIDREQRLFRLAELTEKEKEGISTVIPAKIGKAYLTGAIEAITNKITEISNMSLEQLQVDYLGAIAKIETINEANIQNKLATLISSLILGYQGFSNDFQNIVITGPAGVGKTTLAFTIADAFKKLHILCVGQVQVATRTELVAAYLGQTANKTRTVLYSSLEGILFIDEAYQVGGCPKEDSFGMEALTELVNFLDKWIGITMVLVAGYEEQMKTCFFDRNEGLRRRFPVKYPLDPYGPETLFKVLMASIFRNMNLDFFDRKLYLPQVVYALLKKFNEKGLFPNAGGDMQVLGGKIVRYFLASSNVGQSVVNSFYEFGVNSGLIGGEELERLILETVQESVTELNPSNFSSSELKGLHWQG